ncbi:DUF1294 domain-containing protein [Flavobacterium sp. XS2P12]|uniref:DUF1294 domain-containing protein n=1 Tax=Flavobacterium melibiosi TaxID=3398734 RepID=UPI003A8A9834
MSILFYFFIILNCLTFLVTAYDKLLAIKNKRRISERNLLLTTVIGGTIGSGLAMLVFRHKTSKMSFLWKFFLIGILQVFIVYFYVIKSK